MAVIPLVRIDWTPCWRIIPSRFPIVDLYERIAPPQDWSVLQEIETLTNERVLTDRGKAPHIRAEDRGANAMSSLILAPFCHPDPNGDQFSDGTFGISYALPTFEAALMRSVRSREQFLRQTKEGPITLQTRVLKTDMSGMLHDIRGKIANDYRDTTACRELCRTLRADGSYGLVYEDHFQTIGTTVAAFRPTILSNFRQERHLAYKWDGIRISEVYDYSNGDTRSM